MIVATAGHIDHGKTSLVRAMTGADTDRLLVCGLCFRWIGCRRLTDRWLNRQQRGLKTCDALGITGRLAAVIDNRLLRPCGARA